MKLYRNNIIFLLLQLSTFLFYVVYAVLKKFYLVGLHIGPSYDEVFLVSFIIFPAISLVLWIIYLVLNKDEFDYYNEYPDSFLDNLSIYIPLIVIYFILYVTNVIIYMHIGSSSSIIYFIFLFFIPFFTFYMLLKIRFRNLFFPILSIFLLLLVSYLINLFLLLMTAIRFVA